jgi:hypothetical protein
MSGKDKHTIKAYGVVEVQQHSFLTFSLEGTLHLIHFAPAEEFPVSIGYEAGLSPQPGTLWRRDPAVNRTKIPGTECSVDRAF